MIERSSIENLGLNRIFLERFRSRPELVKKLAEKFASLQLKALHSENATDSQNDFKLVDEARNDLKDLESQMSLLCDHDQNRLVQQLSLKFQPIIDFLTKRLNDLRLAIKKIHNLNTTGSNLLKAPESKDSEIFISKLNFAQMIFPEKMQFYSLDEQIKYGNSSLFKITQSKQGLMQQKLFLPNPDIKQDADSIFIHYVSEDNDALFDTYKQYQVKATKSLLEDQVFLGAVSPENLIKLIQTRLGKSDSLNAHDCASLINELETKGLALEEVLPVLNLTNNATKLYRGRSIVLSYDKKTNQVKILGACLFSVNDLQENNSQSSLDPDLVKIAQNLVHYQNDRHGNFYSDNNHESYAEILAFYLASRTDALRKISSLDSGLHPLLNQSARSSLVDVFVQENTGALETSDICCFSQILFDERLHGSLENLEKYAYSFIDKFFIDLKESGNTTQRIIGSCNEVLRALLTKCDNFYSKENIDLYGRIITYYIDKLKYYDYLNDDARLLCVHEFGFYSGALDPILKSNDGKYYLDKSYALYNHLYFGTTEDTAFEPLLQSVRENCYQADDLVEAKSESNLQAEGLLPCLYQGSRILRVLEAVLANIGYKNTELPEVCNKIYLIGDKYPKIMEFLEN